MTVHVRVGAAGNGTPVFMAAGPYGDLKRPFGAVWDGGRGLWMYPAFYPAASKVLADFEVLGHTIPLVLSDTVREHTRALAETEKQHAARELPTGFEFATKPFDHQIEGLCHAHYLLRAALFYRPGLGKSKIAVDLVRLQRFRGVHRTVLVFGPLTTVQNWGREIDRHSGRTLRWIALDGSPADKRKALRRAAEEQTDIVLVTYDTARNMVDELVASLDYDTAILDESQMVKDWRSDRTKAAYEIVQKARRRLLLTGSPAQGNPLDLYGQYRILGNCFMPEDYKAFKLKFIETNGANSHVIVGFKNLDILNGRTTFLSLEKTKEECLDLPPRTIVDVEYTLTRHQAAIHNQLVLSLELDPDLLRAQLNGARVDQIPPEARLPHRAAMLIKLLQVASGFLVKNNQDPGFCDTVEPDGCRYREACVEERIMPHTPACRVDTKPLPSTVTVFDENPKLDAALELLSEIMESPDNKVIIWCVFRHELDLLEARIKDAGWGYVRVDGSTGSRIQNCVDAFNEDSTVRVYLAQVATGVGITLNAAAYMIYFSLPFSLDKYDQSLDRNYRIGQTKNVTVYRLVGRGTPEQAIIRLLEAKVDVNTVLTKKLSCLVCPQNLRCLAEGVELFDPTCVYATRIARPVIKARALPMAEDP